MIAPETLRPLADAAGITVEELLEAISKSGDLPAIERARYQAEGFAIIEPGSATGNYHGFPRGRWLPSSFLAKNGNEVQISLIAARKPGTGAFSMLLYRLDRLALRVRVVSPLPDMAAILTRKGFVAEHTGTTFEDRKDIWERPAALRAAKGGAA